MVHLQHPIKLRQVIIIKKAFIQKCKMAEKNKIGYKHVIKRKQTYQTIKHNRNVTTTIRRKELQTIDFNIRKQIM